MKNKLPAVLLLLLPMAGRIHAQVSDNIPSDTSAAKAHSVLPNDAILSYLPKDNTYNPAESMISNGKIQIKPTTYFFFRPEGTFNYKEADLPIDTGGLNFYLRGDFGARISLPKNIDMVVNLQSYGTYTRSLGPLDPNVKLYEAYVDMKKLDKKGRMSLQFGRVSPRVYGTELLVGDLAFGRGRSFETVRYRYHTDQLTSELMWVQLYQQAPDSANFDWNHPIFLAAFNTYQFSKAVNFDANLPFVIDQYNSGYRTTVFMPDLRFFGQVGQIQYSAEYILQTGTAKKILNENISGTVNASALEISAGYCTSNTKLCFDLAYYRGSGDDNTADGDLKSYNVLWQNEHRRFGYIDAFKGSNVQATTVHLDWKVGRLVSTGLHAVIANVLELKDKSTGIATVPLGPITTTSTAIGSGGDVYINYFMTHNLNFQLSASIFSPGEYFTAVNGVDETGANRIEKTMTRLYLLMALRI
jgi:hypothetical protein